MNTTPARLTRPPLPCGCSAEHLMGCQIDGIYDGVCIWQCLRCGHAWNRFEEGDPRRARTEPHLVAYRRGLEQGRAAEQETTP